MREIEITLTFAELSETALQEFAHYARAGELTFFIKAKLEGAMVIASLHGIRLANPAFAEFFEQDSAADKKKIYEKLTSTFDLGAKWQNQTQAAETLVAFESNNPTLNVPLPSADKAFGVEGPIPKLRQFIDFVYIPAVKDAGDEAIEARNTAFSKLIERAVRAKLKVEERIEKIRDNAKAEMGVMAHDHKDILINLEKKIDQEYRKFNASDSKLHLEWGEFNEKSLDIKLPPIHLQVSDDLIKNTIGKFGHGTQRNYLMALLMVSASYDFTDLQTIIIGCEEPELYQHLPQARILANALHVLASRQAQVIITTHSPHFVTAKTFENIRLVRRTHSERSRAYAWSIDQNRKLIAGVKGEDPIGGDAARAIMNRFLQPQINEMFFTQFVVFVEGDEDRAILNRYLQLSDMYSNFLTMGGHIIPTDGKGNMINAISIAKGFEIPCFAVFDADMTSAEDSSKKQNKDIMALVGYTGPGSDGSIQEHLFQEGFCIWKNNLQDAIAADVDEWDTEKQTTCSEFEWTIDRLKKNAMVLEATLERVHKNKKVPVLETLCSAISDKIGTVVPPVQ